MPDIVVYSQFVASLQQSMQVPQTPLHTSRVLKEEKDLWEDVKVSYLSPICSLERLGSSRCKL